MRAIKAAICGYLALAALAAPAALSAAEDDPGASATAAGAVIAPAAASAEANAATGKQTTHQVVMKDIAFHPKTINVAVGDTITWVNEDSEPHNAIAQNDAFKTPTIQQGEEASATLDQAGTIPYFCSIHAGMKGTVKVGGGGSGSSGDSGGSGGSGGSGSSGGSGTGSGSFDSSGSTGSTGDSTLTPPSASSSAGGSSSGGSSSLPMTGQDDALWLAFAGAWLLAVGMAIRAAAAQR